MTVPKKPRPLSKAALEELGDTRLLLDTASHNLQAAVRQQAPAPDPDQALDSAITQLEQILSTLKRIQARR